VNGGIMFAYQSGYFSFNNVNIKKTFAVSSVIAEMLDVVDQSSISNTLITDNHYMTYDELESELVKCDYLCFLHVNKTLLYDKIQSTY
jgi:hypothetical protein